MECTVYAYGSATRQLQADVILMAFPLTMNNIVLPYLRGERAILLVSSGNCFCLPSDSTVTLMPRKMNFWNVVQGVTPLSLAALLCSLLRGAGSERYAIRWDKAKT